MNLSQIEHVATLAEPIPAESNLDRMEQLFIDRRRELVISHNRQIRLAAFDERFAGEDWQISDERLRLVNEFNQSEMRLAKIVAEIIEVAGLIRAENAATA